jgi:DNA-binding LytR/AlgR family response regulator
MQGSLPRLLSLNCRRRPPDDIERTCRRSESLQTLVLKDSLDVTDGPRGRDRFRHIVGSWLRILAAAAMVGLILAISGGFGAGGASVITRIVFWLLLVAMGTTAGVLFGAYVVPLDWFARRPILAWAVIVAALSPPMILAVAALQSVTKPCPLTWALVVEVAPSTVATTAALSALAFLIRRRDPVETHGGAADAPPPRFLDRLPARLAGGELWAVEAEDHYLRLHTSKGSDLILMRLGDAIAELEGIEGARTHRSWWVARHAVRDVERDDGRAMLRLPDGVSAPVSRPYAKLLRAAGWF